MLWRWNVVPSTRKSRALQIASVRCFAHFESIRASKWVFFVICLEGFLLRMCSIIGSSNTSYLGKMASASCNLLPMLSPSHSLSITDTSSKTVVKCAASATFPMRGVSLASLDRASCHPESDRAIEKINSLVTEGRVAGAARGAGVLERPGLDQSSPETAPRTEEGGEMGKSAQKVSLGSGDRYRVLLLDDERHTESQVAKVIPSVVPVVTPDEARKCFFESREFGVGLVTVAVKEHAEFYVQMLVRYGLRSSMEQDRSVA